MYRIITLFFLLNYLTIQISAQSVEQNPQIKLIHFNRSTKFKNFFHLFRTIEDSVKKKFNLHSDDISPYDFWAMQSKCKKKEIIKSNGISHLIESELTTIQDKIRITIVIKDTSLSEIYRFSIEDFSCSTDDSKLCEIWSRKLANNINCFIHTGKIRGEILIEKFKCDNTTPPTIRVLTIYIPSKLQRYFQDDDVLSSKYTFSIKDIIDNKQYENNIIYGAIVHISIDSVQFYIIPNIKDEEDIHPIESQKIPTKQIEDEIRRHAKKLIKYLKE